MRELLLKTQQEVHDTNTKWNKVLDAVRELDMSDFIRVDFETNEVVFKRSEYKKRIDLIIKLTFYQGKQAWKPTDKVSSDLEIIRESEDEVDNDQ